MLVWFLETRLKGNAVRSWAIFEFFKTCNFDSATVLATVNGEHFYSKPL